MNFESTEGSLRGEQDANAPEKGITLFALMKIVLENPDLRYKDKKRLIDELRKNNASRSDRWTHRSAIWFLGIGVFLSIIAVFILALKGRQIPESVIAIGSALAGGLVGVLTPGNQPVSRDQTS